MKRVLIAMSGGVDSSVSALLLKNRGFDVAGAHMRLRYELPHERKKSDLNVDFVKKTTETLGIPFHLVDLETPFETNVIKPFIKEYLDGITPNPCIYCNMKIKFGELYKYAKENNFDFLATGHYAHIKKTETGRFAIYNMKDQKKDQSYYLYGLDQEVLENIIFPLDGMVKENVRKIARENNLPAAEREESQEICFVDSDYRDFFKYRNIGFQKGYIRDTQGNILGSHSGRENYTIGQRRGLNIALGSPRYVVELGKNGDVIVGNKEELMVDSFYAEDIRYMGIDAEAAQSQEILSLVQIRYNTIPVEARFKVNSNGLMQVKLSQPVMAVTPGQAAVFYHPEKNYILAGGRIKRS